MNAVREWSAAICLTALVATFLQSLVPGGSMERMVRFVLGAFMICAIIVPLAKTAPQIGTWFQVDTPSRSSSPFVGTVDRQISEAAQESIQNLVITECRNIGVKCKNVRVFMDTNEDGSISINKVVVILAKGYRSDCEKASAHLQKVLGLKTEVIADENG
ncbi:stage III sporulation protein AF [Caproiciproducens galactitolivorans]|uniref:Stage III sporulation protein SpoIIIAF n=1 Tax=Caproiciproducens galactitolivorans TaxID=642589 RepID=A0A4Z0YGM8_9FIRM|nr:stage III sporulation protein AF [Caproiciproducens galactitolivorans]TGJ76082.1 stage III sporulation protein SpoIIIAF [Caproiciproducens galactitolivorans]